MKKLLLIGLALIIGACSNSDDSSNGTESSIYGKWEWYRSVNSDASDDEDGYFSRINFDYFIFSEPDDYLYYHTPDNDLHEIYSGKFSIVNDILTLKNKSINGKVNIYEVVFTDFKVEKKEMQITTMSYDDYHNRNVFTVDYYRKVDN